MPAILFAVVRGPMVGALQGTSVGGGSGAGGGGGAAASAEASASVGASPVIADGGLLAGTDPNVYYALSVAVMAIAIALVLYPLARAWAKRMEGRSAATPVDSGANERMHRLEQSVEALTLEIERISEGQRYTTKLLTERLPLAARVPQPGQSEKTLL